MAKMAKSGAAAQANGKSALACACERAAASNLKVVGRGSRLSDAALVWVVSSQSEPGKRHLVVSVGGRLLCDCQGFLECGGVCIHGGVVFLDMEAEACAFAALMANRLTARRLGGRAVHPRTVTAPAAPGATAPLHRENAPISLFKTS